MNSRTSVTPTLRLLLLLRSSRYQRKVLRTQIHTSSRTASQTPHLLPLSHPRRFRVGRNDTNTNLFYAHQHPSRSFFSTFPSKTTTEEEEESATTTEEFSEEVGGILHHEWIVDGKVVRSNENKVEVRKDKGTVVMLHGILGSGKNLRTPAKKITERNPNLTALLLDLRGHGTTAASRSSLFPPPHTFQSCTNDVIRTLRSLNLVGPQNSPLTIVGHSFGGRIALQVTHKLLLQNQQQALDEAAIINPPKHTWLLDTVPGAPHFSFEQVLSALESVPIPIDSRDTLVEFLTSSPYNLDTSVARWVTTNLISDPSSSPGKKKFRFAFDLDIVRNLMDDFYNQDFMSMMEDVAQVSSSIRRRRRHRDGGTNMHLVMGGKNKLWTEEIVNELQTIGGGEEEETTTMRGGGAGSGGGFLGMYTLPNAGHWVHVDDLEGLLMAMEEGGID